MEWDVGSLTGALVAAAAFAGVVLTQVRQWRADRVLTAQALVDQLQEERAHITEELEKTRARLVEAEREIGVLRRIIRNGGKDA